VETPANQIETERSHRAEYHRWWWHRELIDKPQPAELAERPVFRNSFASPQAAQNTDQVFERFQRWRRHPQRRRQRTDASADTQHEPTTAHLLQRCRHRRDRYRMSRNRVNQTCADMDAIGDCGNCAADDTGLLHIQPLTQVYRSKAQLFGRLGLLQRSEEHTSELQSRENLV